MLRVEGKALITIDFAVDIDAESIETSVMSINESDALIEKAIAEKYGQHQDNIDDIRVRNIFTKKEEPQTEYFVD